MSKLFLRARERERERERRMEGEIVVAIEEDDFSEDIIIVDEASLPVSWLPFASVLNTIC